MKRVCESLDSAQGNIKSGKLNLLPKLPRVTSDHSKNNYFWMKRVWIVIGLVSLFAVIYHAAPFIGLPDNLIIGMFILSPFLLVYMTYVILRYGKPSAYTFDERWYEDKG